MSEALDVYLMELAPEGANVVLAEMARAAAMKVDSCRVTATVGAAQAMPRLVGELRDLLGELAGRSDAEDAVAAVARILRPLA